MEIKDKAGKDLVKIYNYGKDRMFTLFNEGTTVKVGNLFPWQEYLLSQFKPEEFVETPVEMRTDGGAGVFRFGTYYDLVYDTLINNGAVAATTLSMLFKPKVITEFGIYAGSTTMLLSKLNPSAKVYAIDFVEKHFTPNFELPTGYVAKLQQLSNVVYVIKNSCEFDMTGKVDFCFIDGDHCGDAPYKDSWRAWENRNTSEDWCIAWDDYHINNPDVYTAVNKFVKEVGYPLQKAWSWYWIGTKVADESKLVNIV